MMRDEVLALYCEVVVPFDGMILATLSTHTFITAWVNHTLEHEVQVAISLRGGDTTL